MKCVNVIYVSGFNAKKGFFIQNFQKQYRSNKDNSFRFKPENILCPKFMRPQLICLIFR